MKNRETGEFELVLGNKQLLSAFGIVVILFGVFFTMGYIVGSNSVPSARVDGEAQPAPAQPAAAPPQQAARPAAEPPKPEGTQPAQDVPAEPLKEAAAVATPPAGTYLQVSAVKQPEAEVVQGTLEGKGFAVTLAPGPNNLVRVLVGPYGDSGALGKAKADLEKLGFEVIVRK